MSTFLFLEEFRLEDLEYLYIIVAEIRKDVQDLKNCKNIRVVNVSA